MSNPAFFTLILFVCVLIKCTLQNTYTISNTNPQVCHEPRQDNSVNEFAALTATEIMGSNWAQKTFSLPPKKRGCHLVTSQIVKEIQQELQGFKFGLAHFFLQHTSASLTINENYDSDVQHDTETFLNRIVPEERETDGEIIVFCIQGRSAPWRHVMEGPDDMPAHIKSSLFGCSLTIPIKDGHLNMGTWQGIWLCEHRDHASSRNIVVTMNGMPTEG